MKRKRGRPKLDAELRERIIDLKTLKEKCLTDEKIASMLGVTRRTVSNVWNEHNQEGN